MSVESTGHRIIELVERFGSPKGELTLDSDLWESFPPNPRYVEAPAVMRFHEAVESTFAVYLTEADWSVDTIGELARAVERRRSNRPEMLEALDGEIRGIKKGSVIAFVVLSLAVLAALLLAWSARPDPNLIDYLLAWLGFDVLLAAVLYLVRLRELRSLRAKRRQLGG